VADIFLSYASKDRARAKLVASLLKSCSWSVFWDVNIRGGAAWREVLQSELDVAGAVVVLWSHSSVTSTWVREADRGKLRLITVRIDKVDQPFGFGELQAIDLIGWRGGNVDGIGKLVEAVSHKLSMPPPRSPTVPGPPSQKLRVAIAAVFCSALLAAYPLVQWLRKPAPIMNQEIVIDTSEGMSAHFDKGPTKLGAAVEALRTRNLHPAENLALREFGGKCHQDDGSRLLVSFGTNRRERIVSAASALQPRGQPTLVSGVLSALADIQPLPHTKRIVVLTGHADRCQEDAVKEIKERIAAYQQNGQKLTLEWRFIGLAVSAEDQTNLKKIGDSVEGKAYFVNTAAELNDVLEYVLEFEPAVIHVKTVWDVVDQVGRSITDIAHNMNQRKYDEAQMILDAGQASYLKMKPAFDALAGLRLSVNFERFYTLAAENLSLQEQTFDVGRLAIGQGKASGEGQTPEYQQSVKAWNKLVAKYNANINEMNKLSDEIVKQAQKRG
jgi:hypothetical protein